MLRLGRALVVSALLVVGSLSQPGCCWCHPRRCCYPPDAPVPAETLAPVAPAADLGAPAAVPPTCSCTPPAY